MLNVKKSWIDLFENYDTLNSPKIDEILEILSTLETNKLIKSLSDNTDLRIFPKQENQFRCFQYFETHETKVVILGQDPYHGENQATGLSFGVNNKKIPPSLKNIAKVLKQDLNRELIDYSLESWAKQGVLLLNTALTVIEGHPGSQIKLWQKFTEFIINYLNENYNKIIFIAWGAFAYNQLKILDLTKHYLIVSSHPSPLSVSKKFKNYPAFIDSKPFSKVNEILVDNNCCEIEW